MESRPQQSLQASAEKKELPAQPAVLPTGVFEQTLFSERGLRAGWPAALFLLLSYFLQIVLGSIAWATGTNSFHLAMDHFGAGQEILEELAAFAAMVCAALVASRMDGRRLDDYFLRDKVGLRHASVGIAAGFAALSVLVAALCAGGWLHLSYGGLNVAQNLRFAAVWGFGFLLVGLTEEGSFRCFLLGTLERGMNFWWAAGTLAALLGFLLTNADRHGAGGFYAAVAVGIAPCGWLHWRRVRSSQFWQAAWATSAGFGFVHTYNTGETAVGIFSAALIGFTFCVSIRVTGSAWWGIGFHSAWDWAQTYFYGTPDSGLIPQGHLLASATAGSALWSGGKAGPEGSLLVIPVTLLVLAGLTLFYWKTVYSKRAPEDAASPLGQAQLS
ncbi:MAG TPA: CPBP family intramembrane glutamic endopeptidase [Acidobacteriaceae bacterium]|nr:CPBP family intramembrane glutamic endopeptidase [Acidobacteriaceae bacterium]